jgi:hypothetical protein
VDQPTGEALTGGFITSSVTRNAIARLAAALITQPVRDASHRPHWPTFGRTSSTFEPPSP